MAQVVIENPILSSPFAEPKRHFKFDDDGARKKGKAAKIATARNLWVPAVNNDGTFGRWAFVEIEDPWNAANAIREFIAPRSNLQST